MSVHIITDGQLDDHWFFHRYGEVYFSTTLLMPGSDDSVQWTHVLDEFLPRSNPKKLLRFSASVPRPCRVQLRPTYVR